MITLCTFLSAFVSFVGKIRKTGWLLTRLCRSLSPRRPEYLPLIHHICGSEELLRWFLDHGARVDYSDTDPDGVPPLLEHFGGGGSISTFSLLMKAGAKLGRRTLHLAVASASSGNSKRMNMVRFLVEEVGCDVNEMDMPEDKRYSAYYGTPLNHAEHWGGTVEVAKYLPEVSVAT